MSSFQQEGMSSCLTEDILLVVPVRTVRVQVRFQTVPVCAVPVRALCVGCGRFVRFGSLAVRFVRPGSIRIYHDIYI